jgi:hypothetical protein
MKQGMALLSNDFTCIKIMQIDSIYIKIIDCSNNLFQSFNILNSVNLTPHFQIMLHPCYKRKMYGDIYYC